MNKVVVCLCCVVVVAALAFGADPSPRFNTVTPDTGKAGTEFVVTGENLAKTNVAEVYFTDGKTDTKLDIVAQQPTEIKVKAPPEVKPGRYSLMILTGDKSRFLEQPVKVTIE